MTHLDTGKVQIYTGDGKGKTTAAMGLAFGNDRLRPQRFDTAICKEAALLGARCSRPLLPTHIASRQRAPRPQIAPGKLWRWRE